MNPVKIVGGVLIALGFAFRAISLAWFRQAERRLAPGDEKARRRLAGACRRALFWDALVIALGVSVLLAR